MSSEPDKSALSWWFPKLLAAGLPVPRTKIIQMPEAAQRDVWDAFDGKDGHGGMAAFCDDVRAAAADLGLPFFLRTDHTSGKHDWKHTCFVTDPAKIGAHIFAIVEYSEINGMFGGLSWSTWAVREFLPTMPLGTCPNFGDMPVCREFRFFVDGDIIRCFHPYWPKKALDHGGAESVDYDALYRIESLATIGALASAAGRAMGGGSWSIDILAVADRGGWFITDMAEASKSYHWEGCEHAERAP